MKTTTHPQADQHSITADISPIEFTRIKNDVNSNPRYVCGMFCLLTQADRVLVNGMNLGISLRVAELHKIAVKRANKIGGRKYHTKSYGGGIVFQSYNIAATEKRINELLQEA